MDSTLLKSMLEPQERVYKAAMEMLVKQLNNPIKQLLEGKVSDLATSLEFPQREDDGRRSQSKAHEEDMEGAKIKIDNLTEQIELSNKKIKEPEERINYQDNYGRRKNVRVSGMEKREGRGSRLAVSVTAMFQDKIQLPGLVLE